MGHSDKAHLSDFTHPAFSTVHATMLAGQHLIDDVFGQGFAKANPALLAAFIDASTRHLLGELAAAVHQTRAGEMSSLLISATEAMEALGEQVGRIADARG